MGVSIGYFSCADVTEEREQKSCRGLSDVTHLGHFFQILGTSVNSDPFFVQAFTSIFISQTVKKVFCDPQ